MYEYSKIIKSEELMDENIEDRRKAVLDIFNSCEDDGEWVELMRGVLDHVEDVYEQSDEEKYKSAADAIKLAMNIVNKIK